MREAEETYQNPLAARYASREMLRTFSPGERYRTWRRLWIALAEAQAEVGLEVLPEQIEELRRHADNLDLERVAEVEKRLRHDVMAHIHVYGDQCPGAKPIIHLGATSSDITDNADLILMRRGLDLVREKLAALLETLRDFALQYRSLPALAYTHFQPAQFTTVGKRAALWAQDFLSDLKELVDVSTKLRFRGMKGATGTQASFLELFDGDSARVEELDRLVARKMGFNDHFLVTGQTYSRKVDELVLHALAGIALSAHKATNDIRLLQGLGELAEPFEEQQVGSSAMPYKRNPMRVERVSSLAKFVLCTAQNPVWVQATQWLERTLDDSANRRLSIPEAFLATDAMLILLLNVVRGLNVQKAVIRQRLEAELPSVASEALLMLAVREGGDRQELHECIRGHAMVVAERRTQGAPNDLMERLAKDPRFARVAARAAEFNDPARLTGRAAEQVAAFFEREVAPVLERWGGRSRVSSEIDV